MHKYSRVDFTGFSMYPLLKPDDKVIVEFFPEAISIEKIQEGALVVHMDADEVMIHRKLSNHLIKGDWGYSTWKGPVVGVVHGIQRADQQYTIKAANTLAAQLSTNMLSEIKAVRIFNKLLLYFLNLLTSHKKSYLKASEI